MIVTLVVMVVNKIVIPLSDWVIRMDGVIMLVSLFVVSPKGKGKEESL